LGISLKAGTASDLAGNLADAAGPSATFTADNTAPAITISNPSQAYAGTDHRSASSMTNSDTNFGQSTLTTDHVQLKTTGDAGGTLAVSGSGTTWTVSVANLTGNGTLGISLKAGTARDLAGNTAGSAGPSATFTVDNVAPAISIGSPSQAYAGT